ncbi:MAG: hypothetical protein AB7R89_08560 [Dehalococcoidia bacterium]
MIEEYDARRSPPQEPSLGRLACFIPGFLLVVAIAVGGGLVLINCLRATPSTRYTTDVERLPLDQPVLLSRPGIYLVRTADEVIALDHHELNRADALQGCVIRFRETLAFAGRTGFFRSDCTGTIYALDGTPVQGPGPPMKRHPVKRDGAKVTVDFTTCTDPAAGDAVVPCNPV